MGKRSRRRQSQQSRARQRKSTAQQRFGLWIALFLSLAVLIVLVYSHVPPGLFLLISIFVCAIILLALIVWFVFCYRLTPEEQAFYAAQQKEAVRMEATAQVVQQRSVELQDLAYLDDKEFELFTGVLMEAMGVLSDWECVGGGGDHGIDLRGKNKYGLLLVVQCKRIFSGNIPAKQTREFGWVFGQHDAREAWFVTTTKFTPQAVEDVRKLTYKGDMILVDGKKLMEFLWDHWHALPDQWQWKLAECMAARDRQRQAT